MSRTLQGTVCLPGSKSESNRALMIAAYGGFPLEVVGLSDAHDTLVLKELLSPSLRAERSEAKQSNLTDQCLIVDCEDAGTVARFLMTYLVGKPGHWLLTGTERLCQRPMAPLIGALRQLGASVTSLRAEHSGARQPEGSSTEGRKSTCPSLPLRIEGSAIKGGSVTLDASQSSQFASSLLLAAPTW